MEVFTMTMDNSPLIAKLMTELMPEWWDYNGALEQITGYGIIGWYIGENACNPMGWMCVREIKPLSCLELDCFGFNDNGFFSTTEGEISFLYDKAEQYASEKGFRIVRTTMTSSEMSCHNKVVTHYAEELKTLQSYNKRYYDYMLRRGYQPAGFMPNCYGVNFHGIILIKDVTRIL